MVLLCTSYRYGGFLEYYFKQQLVRFGVYMVKNFHEKMLILRRILPKKRNPPPQKNFKTPLGIISTCLSVCQLD